MRIVQFLWLDKAQDIVDVESIPISFCRNRSALQQSVSKNGVFMPILVRRSSISASNWQIVSGQGRWQIDTKNKIPALEIECDEEEALLIYIQENLGRGFNIIEIAKIIERFHQKFDWTLNKISNVLANLLDLPLGIKVLQDYLAILKLPSSICENIVQDNLPLRVAIIFADFSSNEAIFLSKLCRKMRWNANKQREILTYLWEICQRDKTTIIEIIQKQELQEFLESENPAQYAELVRQKIFALKNPNLNQAQMKFTQSISKISWPVPVLIQPSSNFEQNQISFQFNIDTPENFQKVVAQLQDIRYIVTDLLTIGK